MLTEPEGQKCSADAIGNAVKVMLIATCEGEVDFGPDKDEAMAEMDRNNAAVRSAAVMPERCAEIARKAAAIEAQHRNG